MAVCNIGGGVAFVKVRLKLTDDLKEGGAVYVAVRFSKKKKGGGVSSINQFN